MKNFKNYLITALCVGAVCFVAGSFVKVNAAGSPLAVSAPAQPVDLTYAAEKALPAVVHIKNVQNSKVQTVEVESDPFGGLFPFGDFFGFGGGRGGTQKRQMQTPKREKSGSGVIISSDGYIVTNNHVVEGADELTVTLNDNREFSARIIGTDKATDLALIKVDGSSLPSLAIGDSDKLKVGEWVLAVGNPFNLTSTVTAGIVSAKARSLGANGVESFIQTDAAINAGNSGGALVNTQGELIGINAMLYSETGSYSGYGFAIPTTLMNKVVDDLKTYGTVQRAMLGIHGSNAHDYIDMQKAEGKEVDLGVNDGIYVAKVEEDGSGADAGLKEGDVITSLDGKKVTKMSELQEILYAKKPGDKLTLTFMRDKKAITKTVTLKNAQGNTNVVKTRDIDILGGQFRPVSETLKKNLEISYGLEVTKVDDGKLKESGISKGFIIQMIDDSPIRSIDDLQKAVEKAYSGKEQTLYVKGIWPTGKKGYFAVELYER